MTSCQVDNIALPLQMRQSLWEEDVCRIVNTMLEKQLMQLEVSVNPKNPRVSLLVTSSLEGMRWSQSRGPSKIKCRLGQSKGSRCKPRQRFLQVLRPLLEATKDHCMVTDHVQQPQVIKVYLLKHANNQFVSKHSLFHTVSICHGNRNYKTSKLQIYGQKSWNMVSAHCKGVMACKEDVCPPTSLRSKSKCLHGREHVGKDCKCVSYGLQGDGIQLFVLYSPSNDGHNHPEPPIHKFNKYEDAAIVDAIKNGHPIADVKAGIGLSFIPLDKNKNYANGTHIAHLARVAH